MNIERSRSGPANYGYGLSTNCQYIIDFTEFGLEVWFYDAFNSIGYIIYASIDY